MMKLNWVSVDRGKKMTIWIQRNRWKLKSDCYKQQLMINERETYREHRGIGAAQGSEEIGEEIWQ